MSYTNSWHRPWLWRIVWSSYMFMHNDMHLPAHRTSHPQFIGRHPMYLICTLWSCQGNRWGFCSYIWADAVYQQHCTAGSSAAGRPTCTVWLLHGSREDSPCWQCLCLYVLGDITRVTIRRYWHGWMFPTSATFKNKGHTPMERGLVSELPWNSAMPKFKIYYKRFLLHREWNYLFLHY